MVCGAGRHGLPEKRNGSVHLCAPPLSFCYEKGDSVLVRFIFCLMVHLKMNGTVH